MTTNQLLPLNITALDAMAPAERLHTLRRMAHMIDGYTRDTVTQARADGASWSEIGDALYVTRQAAQQRYGS